MATQYANWPPEGSGGGGVSTVGPIDSVVKSADGANIIGSQLFMQTADTLFPGLVSIGTQSFAGNKTFTGNVAVDIDLDVHGNLFVDLQATILGNLTAANFSGSSSGTNTGDVTLGAVGSSPNANAATLIGQQLILQPASLTSPGVITTGVQTFGGNKTFNGSITASNFSGSSSGTNTGDITITNMGSTPTTAGATLLGQTLTLQPANQSFPGLITIAAQNIAGVKTFINGILSDSIDSTGAVLTMGAAATTINIGNPGSTINIQGSTIYENTPILQVVDPLITLNKGGAAASGGSSGIEIEEGGVITGYAKTSVSRNSWDLKAPNTAGIATITPGASGITLDQSSHDPVTLGTANGLSLSTQVLSLQLASGSQPGALSAADFTAFSAKQPAGNYITDLTGDVTATGPASAVATIANSAVTNAKMANMPANTIKGNATGVSAAPQDLTVSQIITLLNSVTTNPTVTRYLSGSGTYTTPANVVYLKVRMVGGGGGGGGASSAGSLNGGNAGAGGNTTFGTSLLTAAGGTGGTGGSAGAAGGGGSPTINAPAIAIASYVGGSGGTGAVTAAVNVSGTGGAGGVSAFGGVGVSNNGNFAGGNSAVVNSGSGGSGGSVNQSSASTAQAGGGGGAGAYIEALIAAPAASYAYSVGAGGTAGAAGTGGAAGGSGGSGYIEITEYYGTFANAVPVSSISTPTQQRFTSGTAQTYTTPAGVKYIKVRMVGGGGGGGGGSAVSGGNGGPGTAGGTTTFGTSLLTANGGLPGAGNSGAGTGGSGTINSPAVGFSITGGSGGSGAAQSTAGVAQTTGTGGSAAFFCGGGSGSNAASVGNSAIANTGGGGAGGGGGFGNPAQHGGGGGAGAYVEAIISSPAATYTYTVGAGGAVGAAGTSGNNGGAGAAGIIIVDEYYI